MARPGGRDEIGRHAGFRCRWRKPWGFESLRPHSVIATLASRLDATVVSRMTPTEPRPVEFMRSDAARNVHRIVEVAARLLGDDPQMGMAEVATAAGISRATVYRHFASRDALIEAIRRQAAEQGEQALARCRLDEGSATEALRRVVAAWLDLAERYSFPQLAAQSERTPPDEDRERRRRVYAEPLLGLIRRGQR